MSDTKTTETKEAPKAEKQEVAQGDPVTTSQDWQEGDPTPSEVAEELRVEAQAKADKAAKESAKEA